MFIRITVILTLIALTAIYSFWQKGSLESQLAPASGGAAVLAKMPSAVFETFDGKPYSLDELYSAQAPKLLVVHYWGTWCAPCEAEFPELLKFIEGFKDRPGVKFLLVAVNDDLIKVKKHLKDFKLPEGDSVVWLLDNNNVHKDIFGTTRVPETYVFSSDKTTLRKFLGPQDWNKPSFFQTFDEYHQISSRKL